MDTSSSADESPEIEQSDGRLTDGQLTEIEKTPKLIQRKLSAQTEDLKNFEEAKALFSDMEKMKSPPGGAIRITDVSKPTAIPRMGVMKQKDDHNQSKSPIFSYADFIFKFFHCIRTLRFEFILLEINFQIIL